MAKMYEILLGLPLFSGVTYERISEVIGSSKFHFLKYEPGQEVISAGELCTHIKCIVSGSVSMTLSSSDDRFRISQTLSAPEVIAPDFLFGRATRYPCRVTSNGKSGILQISKADYLNILHSDRVFLFNFLNLLSRNAQKSVDGVLALTTGSLIQRIAFWIIALTQHNATDIVLTCRHRDLYTMFGVQRTNFYAALDSLRHAGLLDYSQSEIHILSRNSFNEILLGD